MNATELAAEAVAETKKPISQAKLEANRRNAENSTGPTTPEGKQRSRGNALRHGLTAETVIGVLESAEDYAAFETAIMAEYDPQSVIESELVARLASLLWRLRRATAIETGLFGMQADPLVGFRLLVGHNERTLSAEVPQITESRSRRLRRGEPRKWRSWRH